MVDISTAQTEEQYNQVRTLMSEYVEWDSLQTRQLGLNVREFSEFYYSKDSHELPGEFAPPDGCLLLATDLGTAVGCGAFRKINSQECEMKRLYVRGQFRGRGIAKELAETLIRSARSAGYVTMRLETTKFMLSAIALYTSLGFQTSDPYYPIPLSFREITVFMELDLGKPGPGPVPVSPE